MAGGPARMLSLVTLASTLMAPPTEAQSATAFSRCLADLKTRARAARIVDSTWQTAMRGVTPTRGSSPPRCTTGAATRHLGLPRRHG